MVESLGKKEHLKQIEERGWKENIRLKRFCICIQGEQGFSKIE